MSIIEVVAIAIALAVLMTLMLKGANVYLSAAVALFTLCLIGSIPVWDGINSYMDGFVNYLKRFFPIFMSTAIFGKLMAVTRASNSVALLMIRVFGEKYVVLAVGAACALLTFCGVSVFISIFALVPIAVEIFQRIDIPHRFMPATLLYGGFAIGHTAPGSPMNSNVIPVTLLKGMGADVTLMAGAVIGWAVCAVMFAANYWIMLRLITAAKANGEHFTRHPDDPAKTVDESALPPPALALIPLLSVIFFVNAPLIGGKPMWTPNGVACGSGLLFILLFKYFDFKKIKDQMSDAFRDTILMTTGISAVVGFASVVKLVPAFGAMIEGILAIPGPPLISAAIVMTLVAGITGSGSGALGIVVPILGPEMLAKGVDPSAFSRVMTMSSCGFDSLPHNGAVAGVTLACNEKTGSCYMPMFWVTVVVPTLGSFVAAVLFSMFPGLP